MSTIIDGKNNLANMRQNDNGANVYSRISEPDQNLTNASGTKIAKVLPGDDTDKENGNYCSDDSRVSDRTLTNNSLESIKKLNDTPMSSIENMNNNSMFNMRDNSKINNGSSQTKNNSSRTIQTGNISTVNLRESSLSKSNPQLNTTSLVDVHPLSSSFMDSNDRNAFLTTSLVVSPSESNVRVLNPNAISQQNFAGTQVRYSNQMDEQAIRRLTESFTPSQIPIIGYEVMEERARFTIYKLRIDDPKTGLSWMVFRRYTDFVRLYQKLKVEHRNLVLPLPEKRLFRNNFDPVFLDERARGLQIFVNAVMKRLSLDRSVREFFCLDEPPPVGDSEPEAQALFGALEDTVGTLKNQIRQQEETIKYMRQKVFYLEEKMKSCSVCNPIGIKSTSGRSPDSSAASSDGS